MEVAEDRKEQILFLQEDRKLEGGSQPFPQPTELAGAPKSQVILRLLQH